MSHALGQPVLLSALVRDQNGALANATGVQLYIGFPDGGNEQPNVTNPPAVTGTYTQTYVPQIPGLFSVRWTFTGTNASAPILDSFYVEPQSAPPIVSLAEARKQCRLASPADDPLVQRFALVASDLCEQRTRVWRRTTVTEKFDGGEAFLQLARAPVLDISSVIEGSQGVGPEGYTLDRDLGWLYRGSTTVARYWAYGRQNVTVTYVAGSPTDIPHPIRQGVLLLIQHLWDSQRGGSGLPRQSGTDFEWDPRAGFTIPNAVLELWRPYMLPSIA